MQTRVGGLCFMDGAGAVVGALFHASADSELRKLRAVNATILASRESTESLTFDDLSFLRENFVARFSKWMWGV